MKLSPQQLKAVEAPTDRPIMLLAGAGSGKTATLIQRIAYLVEEKRFKPDRIQAMTFTKKGAEEMKERLAKLSPKLAKVPVGTIHSVCLGILRACGFDGEILTHGETKAILEKPAKEAHLKVGWKVLLFWNQYLQMNYESWEVRHIFTSQFLERSMGYFLGNNTAKLLIKVLQEYEQSKQMLNKIDFTDMLVQVDRYILAEGKDYEQFKRDYILVDEQQDTNPISWNIARKLARSGGLFVVGDPDQKIFGFNGADDKDNIFGFRTYFPEGRIIKLQRNYRSTEVVVSVADKIIAANYTEANEGYRKQMKWRKRNAGGEPVVLREYANEDVEAQAIVEECKSLFSDGMVPADIFVIYRTNAQSRALEDAFVEANIPYVVKNSNSFYNRKKVKDIIAYIHLALDTSNDDAFERVYNIASSSYPTHYRGLGKAYLSRVRDNGSFYYEGMQNLMLGLNPYDRIYRACKDLEDMVGQIKWVINAAEQKDENGERNLASIVKLIRHICYDDYIRRDEGDVEEDGDVAFRDLEQLEVAIAQFDSLQEFLKHVKKMQKAHEAKEEEAVVFTTIHRVKGLERNVVFGVGLCDGILPHARAIGVSGGKDIPSPYVSTVEDERCMMFVLVTRAKQKLYLSHLQSYAGKPAIPSRFLYEGELLQEEIVGSTNDKGSAMES